MKQDTKDCIKGFSFLFIFTMVLILLLDSTGCYAQTTKSEWVEKNAIEIPYELEVHKGVTKYGNNKYWFELEDIKVYMSSSNYQKYINKEIVLMLVEWYNPTTKKYRYTTRQKVQESRIKRLDVDNLW